MPRPKFQTLTEQMFYILLCLKDECYGIDIFDKILTVKGREMLDNETQKLRKRVADYDTLFGKGDDQ